MNIDEVARQAVFANEMPLTELASEWLFALSGRIESLESNTSGC